MLAPGPDDRARAGDPRGGDPRFGRPGPGLAVPPRGAPGGPGAPGPGGSGGPGGPGGPGGGSGPGGPAAGKGPRGGRTPVRRDARGRPIPRKRTGRKAKDEGPVVPVRRMLSLAIGGFSLLLAFGLVIGSQATQTGFTIVIFGAQLLFVLAWTVASRPPSPWVVAIVGLLTAAGSSVAVNLPVDASLAPIGYVIAGGFAAAVVGQLALRGGRAGVTESLGVTMAVVVGVSAFAAFAVLSRQPLGDQVLLTALAAVGVGLLVARWCDVFAPSPRISSQVPRGSTGIIAGAMAGTGAAAITAGLVDGLGTLQGALAGMAVVLVALVVDLGTGYAEAGRSLEGDAPFMWLARHMQGPLGAFAFAAPVSYVVGVILR